MSEATADIVPLYQKVKNYIIEHIDTGAWRPEDRVPSEAELVRAFGVSRMTANRAVRELTREGYLTRVPGVGTFVADYRARAHPLEIRSVADEIRERGHEYSARVEKVERIAVDESLADASGFAAGDSVFHSVILHKENGIPLQLEDRFVSPAVAPGYGDVDFTTVTPHQYLMEVAPLQEAEHRVKAVMPDERRRLLLGMQRDEPCLLLLRRTWSKGRLATFARLYYPGGRFEFSGRFTP